MESNPTAGGSAVAVQEDLSTTNDVSSSIFLKEEMVEELEMEPRLEDPEGAAEDGDNEDSEDEMDDDVFHPPENDSCKTTVITTTNTTTTRIQPSLDPLAESYRVIMTEL